MNERYRPSGRHPREFSSRHALPVRSNWQAHEGGSGGGSGGGDGVGDGDGNAGGDGGNGGGGAGGDGGEAGDRSAWSAKFTAAAAPASSAASSAALPFSSASATASPVGSAVAILATRRRNSANLTGRISASALREPAGDWWPRPINSSAAAANSRAAARRNLVAIMSALRRCLASRSRAHAALRTPPPPSPANSAPRGEVPNNVLKAATDGRVGPVRSWLMTAGRRKGCL